MGIHLRAFDDSGLKHLNNEMSRLESLITILQAQGKVEAPVDTSLDSDQNYLRPTTVVAEQEDLTVTEPLPETDQKPEETQTIASMKGYSPTVTMQKDGKHAIVDWSTWPGIANADDWITHYKVYASTTNPCPIEDQYVMKKVPDRYTITEVTKLNRTVIYDFRVCPFRKEGKNWIQGGPSD